MKKIAVVIDSWKLPFYRDILGAAGYVFEELDGPMEGCITLDLSIEDTGIAALKEAVEKAQNAAYASQLN